MKSSKDIIQRRIDFILSLPKEELQLIFTAIDLIKTKNAKAIEDFPIEKFIQVVSKIIAYFINDSLNHLAEDNFYDSILAYVIKKLAQTDVDIHLIQNIILDYMHEEKDPLRQKIRVFQLVNGLLNEIKLMYNFYRGMQEILFRNLSKQKFLVHNHFKVQ